jgi:cold shock CspA family protein
MATPQNPISPDPAPAPRVPQGTVRDFDERSRTGSIFLDDGTVLEFGAAAFGAGGLRLLRAGQRVRFDTGPGGELTRVTLITFR